MEIRLVDLGIQKWGLKLKDWTCKQRCSQFSFVAVLWFIIFNKNKKADTLIFSTLKNPHFYIHITVTLHVHLKSYAYKTSDQVSY